MNKSTSIGYILNNPPHSKCALKKAQKNKHDRGRYAYDRASERKSTTECTDNEE